MSAPLRLQADSLWLGRYQLQGLLGQGGMGTVYRAHDQLLDRAVAVKVLNAAGMSGEGRARLLREARAAARLNHPNIVSVYDAGEAEDVAFIILELVEGASLYERQPLPLEQVLAVAGQVCAALEHAHAHGVLHRDLKPENVILTPDGTAKLMDFGLARSAAPSRVTPDGALLGTVFYMAPEQALGQPTDGRADLYALGVMLYELVTGQLPFTGDDPLIIIAQHLHAPVPPPSARRADLSPALEAVILKLLAKTPAERFASARDVAQALADGQAGRRPGAAYPARQNLPMPLTRFIGREREMADVRRLLTANRLVTLTGSGGSGKTRLALQVAEALNQPEPADAPRFPDGIWLVELASLADPRLVPQTVAALMEVREEPGHALVKTLADSLRAKALLLILDNCEHLIEACAQLAEALLHACPQVHILATSREALGISGETALRVPSLAAPDPQRLPALEALARYEAVRLFVDRAAAARPDFSLTEANAAAVAQICFRLDGLPLALELAAARVRAMSVEQLAARLDDRFRLLTGGSRTALPRQQTLRALVDWSWELLMDAERALLRRLSVFVGGWTLEAAEQVTGENGVLPAGEVLDRLTQLVDKSLVVLDEQPTQTRYHLLETLRQYAREKLLEAGETESVRGRHLAFYLNLAAQAEPELRRAAQLTWLDRLETEHDNLRAALQWALNGGAPAASMSLAGDLARFWYLRGYWREGRAWLREALTQPAQLAPASEAERRARAKALRGAGWLANEDGHEVTFYTESLALSRALGDTWGAAFALRGLGAGVYVTGGDDHTAPLLAESLELFRQIGDPWGIGAAHYNLGWVAFGQDDSGGAGDHWSESLRCFRQSGDRWGIAVALSSLGYLARLRGEYARSTAFSEESLRLFRELGDKAGIATSLMRLGNVAYRRGDYRQALNLLDESLTLDRERGDPQGIMNALNFMGLIGCYQGDYARAADYLEESIRLGREIGDLYNLPYALGYRGLTHYYEGHAESAERLWQEALDLHRQAEDRGGLAFALNGLGLVARARGDFGRAAELAEAALALYRELGDKRYIANVLHDLGHIAQAAGDAGRAARLFRESLALRKYMGDKQGLAETLEGLARAEPGQAARAARWLAAADRLRAAIGAPVPPVERQEVDQSAAALRTALGDKAFAEAWEAGRALTLEQAVALALE